MLLDCLGWFLFGLGMVSTNLARFSLAWGSSKRFGMVFGEFPFVSYNVIEFHENLYNLYKIYCFQQQNIHFIKKTMVFNKTMSF